MEHGQNSEKADKSKVMQYLLGFDFGGTKGAVGIASAGGDEVIARRRFEVPAGADGGSVYAEAIRCAAALLAGNSAPVAGIGVSFGGHVNVERGVIARSLHVPGWDGFPLSDRLEGEFDAPVLVDNDANAGALGEWRFGAGRGYRNLFYVTVSTGVGGGWIIDNRLARGADGMAGEVGHMLIVPDGPMCSCGRRGCLEAVASGRAIARRAQEITGREQTAKDVAAAAGLGVEWAEVLVIEAAEKLGTGLGNVLCLMNPEIVVLGGGVTKSGDNYWRQVRTAAAARALPGVQVEIVPAKYADEAPLYGALALAEQAANRSGLLRV